MVNLGLFTSKTCEWETPQDFFDKLNDEFHFTLDVCATLGNAKVGKYIGQDKNPPEDGLEISWHWYGTAGKSENICWMNPPYGREIGKWMRKAYKESFCYGATVVCLVPARTDTKWWHDYAMKAYDIRFIKGRLKFGDSKNNAPFPSAVVVFRPKDWSGNLHDPLDQS